MIVLLICLTLITTPFLVWQGWGDGIRLPKEFLSVLLLMAIVVTGLTRYKMRPFKGIWLLLFWLWCYIQPMIFSVPLPIFMKQAVIEMPSTFLAWRELFYITVAMLSIYVIASGAGENSRLKIFNMNIEISEGIEKLFNVIANAVCIAVIIGCIYSIVQTSGLDEFFRTCDPGTGWVAEHPLGANIEKRGDLSRRVVACVGNPSILGIWLALCSPICLYRGRRIGYVAFILSVIVIAITQSFTAILGLAIGTGIYLFFMRKKLFLYVIIALIPIAYVFSSHTPIDKLQHFLNPTGRIEVHKEAWNVIKEKALTGIGPGTFEYTVGRMPNIVTKLHNESWRELHDEYGQIFFTTGLVGLILFMAFILSSVRRFFRNITPETSALFASLIVFLFVSISYFPMRVAPLSVYGVIFTGLFLNLTGERE